jgi:hypothetical protein
MIRRPPLARGLCFAALLALAAAASAQLLPRPGVPDAIRAPAGEQVVLVAHASGSQIYVCGRGSDGKPQWTLKAPQAELRDPQGNLIIHHSAGPLWKHRDGSAVTAKAVAKAPAPDPGSIPWLLLSAVSHDGAGVLARVSSVQRIHTQGGQPPAADQCDAGHQNLESWIPYSADYYFFAPAAAH